MEQATRILLIRHGQTAWNADARVQGQLDIGLNALGHWQAQRVAAALAGEELAAVYSSDLARARDTALPLALQRELPVRTDPALRERSFGDLQGLGFAEVQQRWPEVAERWRAREPGFQPGGGESLLQFRSRVVARTHALAAAHAGHCIALVTHGGVLDLLYRDALRLDLQAPRTWPTANAAINRLVYSPQGFSLVGWGDVSHLE